MEFNKNNKLHLFSTFHTQSVLLKNKGDKKRINKNGQIKRIANASKTKQSTE